MNNVEQQVAIITGLFSVASAVVAWLVSRAKAHAEIEKIDTEKDQILIDSITQSSVSLVKQYQQQAETLTQRVTECEAKLVRTNNLLLKFQMAFRILYTQLYKTKTTPLLTYDKVMDKDTHLTRLREIYLDISTSS